MFALTFFSIGIIGHLIMRRSMDIGNAIRLLCNNQRGEGDASGDTVTFDAKQQAHIDKLIAAKAADYHSKLTPLQQQLTDLNKFKTEYEKSQETKTLAEQEKAKEYDLAKKGYETKISDLSSKLTEREQAIQDRDIRYELINEISRQGGFTEETLAMVRSNTIIDATGKVVIKTKDANGVDITLPVADGIKKLLTDRPHLVKASFKPGSGSGGGQGDGGSGGSGGNGGEESLEVLNAKYAEALKGTDLKLRSELRAKVQAAKDKRLQKT